MDSYSRSQFTWCALACFLALSACSSGTGDDPQPPSVGVDSKADVIVVDETRDGSTGDSSPDDQTADMPDTGPSFTDPNPNLLSQDRLFMCDGTPGASPARLRRIEASEWSRSIHSPLMASYVPLTSGTGHLYSTYAADETIDSSVLREFLTQNGRTKNQGIDSFGRHSSWVDVNGNSYPRIALNKKESPIKAQLECFQVAWTGDPVNAQPDDACTEGFVRALLQHAVYFRPPTQPEVDQLVVFAKAQVAKESQGDWDREETINMIKRAAWMTTSALFRSELGEGPLADGRRPLGPWERARALSMALGDHNAGLSNTSFGEGVEPVMLFELVDAAENGTIMQPEVIEAIVRRYAMGTDPSAGMPDAKAGNFPPNSTSYSDEYWLSPRIQRFFREWLGYDHVDDVFKDHPEKTSVVEDYQTYPALYTEQVSGQFKYEVNRIRIHKREHELAFKDAKLIGSLDEMIARIVVDGDRDVFKQLMTSRRFFLPASTRAKPYPASLYGYDSYNGGAIGSDASARWGELESQDRAGVLTHPAWLASHGGNFEDDPSAIHRGRWMFEQLLCGDVPDLPVGVDAMLTLNTTGESARQRMETQLDDNVQCSGCHNMMNPLGYVFERYNHAGYTRKADYGDGRGGASTLLVLPGGGDDHLGKNMMFNDAVSMMDAVSKSPRAKRCFVRQSFRYFMGRDETYADACSLDRMEQAYDTKGSMLDMLVALFTSDAFLYRFVPSSTQEQP